MLMDIFIPGQDMGRNEKFMKTTHDTPVGQHITTKST
jgi:hypothetical protein